MAKRKNFGRKRPILIGSNRRTDISTTNTEISPTTSSYMHTPASTPLAISEQNSAPSRQSTWSERIGAYLEVPGSRSSPWRYHRGLGVITDQPFNVAISPSTPSTSSLRTARSFVDSNLTPTLSAVTGYSPIVDQQYPSTAHNVDSQSQRRSEALSSFPLGSNIIPPLPQSISGNQYLNQGLQFLSQHADFSAQNMLRPPETCLVTVVGYGTALMAKNDMRARHCVIFSSAVNRHRFQSHPCPRGAGLTYTTAVGYIPNPGNCVILKLEFKNIQIETSLAIADVDGPPGGPEIYLGQDFWTRFYNISSSLPDVSGTHNSLAASPHIQSATTLPRNPGNSEAWPPTVYAPATQMNRSMPVAGGFQGVSAVPNYDYGTNDSSLLGLSSTEPAGNEVSVGYHPPFGGPSLNLQSSYVRLHDDGNHSTSISETIPGQYGYASPTSIFSYGFGASDISEYDIGQGGMQAPNWDRPAGPGTESCS